MKILLLALLLGLVGCGDYTQPDTSKRVTQAGYLKEVTTGSGRPCVAYKDGYGGGLSCDWNYQPTPKEPQE